MMDDTVFLIIVIVVSIVIMFAVLLFALTWPKDPVIKLTRKVDLYYGLCGWKIETIEVTVNEYFNSITLFDEKGYKISKGTTINFTFKSNGDCDYKVEYKNG